MINNKIIKNQKTFPLKRFILRTQTLVAIVFILAYTIIVNLYFIAGLNESNYQDLQLEAHHFAMQYKQNPQLLPPSSIHFTGFINWQNVPKNKKVHFPALENMTKASSSNIVLTHENQWFWSPKEVIYVVTLPLADNNILYLFRHINNEKYAISNNSQISLLTSLTLPIAALFFILLRITVKLTLRYNLKRINHLDRWVGELNLDNVEAPVPNFNFNELNRIANKQRNTLLKIKSLLENEQNFLRHASHELRTPIAVVRSNSELLERMWHQTSNETAENQPPAANLTALNRIARAANNMQQLTETLLWLSREESNDIVCEKVSIRNLIIELIEDNNYLLKGKSVEVFTTLAEDQLTLAYTPCRLVLSNIIRNAFQYTQNGAINITYNNKKVRIDNVNNLSGELAHINHERQSTISNDYGFGLGLRLVEKVIAKLAWHYQNIAILDGRSVEIDFSTNNQD